MPHRFFHPANKQVGLTIIGMGVAGTSLFIQLVKQLDLLIQANKIVLNDFSLELIEKSDVAGPGYAYHPSIQHSSAWTLNIHNTSMSLFGEFHLISDFDHWLSVNKEKCKNKYVDDSALLENLDHSLYAPRKIFGDYCRARLEDYIVKARSLGIKVKLSENTEVVGCDKSEKGDWIVRSECKNFGSVFLSKYIVITTGYARSKENEIKQSMPTNIFDAYVDYQILDKEKSVIIRGSGLTAIDALKELLKRDIKGKIYLVSPSGDLPKIKPDSGFLRHQFTYLTKMNLEVPQLSIDTILVLFCKELGIYSENSSAKEVLQNFIAHPSQSAHAIFFKELAEVNGKPREWQKILSSMWDEVLFMIAHHICEQDREEFFTRYFNYFLKWAAGMTLENANIISTVLGKQVYLASVTGDVCYCDNSKEFQIITRDGEIISGAHLINAIGAGYNINQNRLLNEMQTKNLISSHKNPGGIKVDKQFHIYDPGSEKAHDNAWGIGAITFGSNPSANSTICAAIDSLKVVNELVPRLALQRIPQHQPDPEQLTMLRK